MTLRNLILVMTPPSEVERQLVAGALRGQGFAVDVAGDGESASRLSEITSYSLLLVDALVDGIERLTEPAATRRAQRDPSRPPLLLLGGTPANEAPRWWRDLGADDHLEKPCRLGTVLTSVNEWAHRRATPGEALLPAFDRGPLDAMRATPSGDRIARVAIDAFLQSAPEQLAGLDAAARDGATERVRLLAHTLKSSSAMLGLPMLAALMRQLESQASTLEASSTLDLLTRATAAFGQAEPELRAYDIH